MKWKKDEKGKEDDETTNNAFSFEFSHPSDSCMPALPRLPQIPSTFGASNQTPSYYM